MSFSLDDIENILYQYSKLLLYPMIGIELEFYLLKRNVTQQNFVELGIYQIEEEEGINQFEAKFQHTTCISQLISNIEQFISILHKEFGAIFAAKPFFDKPGNAMHINLSILDNTKSNIFSVEKHFFLNSVAGLYMFIPNSMLCFAPWQSCYLRYKESYIHTPNTISWGMNNRTVAIRCPEPGVNSRIEHRLPCADSNPTDSIAAVLLAAYYGIKNNIMPAAPAIYGLANDLQYNAAPIPLTIAEAKKYKTVSELLKDYYRL